MKKNIHPVYDFVVFEDMNNQSKFLTRCSNPSSAETIKWEDGNTYPLVKVEISSTSHPFYTNEKILVDTQGRVERFRKRYERFQKKPSPKKS